MIKVGHCKILLKLRGYVKKNWGSPFIVAFILLLLGAALSLSWGLTYFAESISIYAFYALVAGVALQFGCLLKYREASTSAEVPNEPS